MAVRVYKRRCGGTHFSHAKRDADGRCLRCRELSLFNRPPEFHFMRHVDKDPVTGCWNWTGQMLPHGYGKFTVNYKTPDGVTHWKNTTAHRWAWMFFRGQITERDIDHLCRNRRCVNPDHLQPVPHIVNINRRPGSGLCKKGHHMRGHNRMPAGFSNGTARFRCRMCYESKLKRNIV